MVEIALSNGINVELSFDIKEAHKGEEIDIWAPKTVVHRSFKSMMWKMGLDEEEFVYNLQVVLDLAYLGRKLNPYQEIHCKVGENEFDVYALFCKGKNEGPCVDRPFDICFGVKDVLNEEEKRKLKHLERMSRAL